MIDKRNRARHSLAWATAVSLTALLTAAPAQADRRTESTEAYSRGFDRFERGDVRGARIELMKALQADPENELARLLQARVMLENGAGVAAQTELEKAMRAGVPRDKTRHLMAHALILQRQFARALTEADPAAVPAQFAPYAARMRGRAHLGLDAPDRARAEFELAQRLAPQSADALADLGRFRLMSGDAAAGEKLVDRALTFEPTHVPSLLLKADFTRRRAGLERAMPYYNQAVQVDANDVDALLQRASALSDLKRVEEARADIRRVQGLVPDHPLALYLEAVLEARAGRYPQANALMTRTKGLLNRYPPALLLQGMLAYQLGDMQQADEYLAKVVAQVPQNEIARKIHGAVLLRKGDPQGAVTTLQPLIASGRADARTLALMGAAQARRGNFDAAQGYFERAARAAPNEKSLRTQLAMTRAAQGDTAAASRDIAAALKDDPNSLQALMLASMLDLQRGRTREAIATTNRLVKAHPASPIGYNLRGMALLRAGDRKGAEANFRAAIGKKGDFVDARRNLASLLAATGRTAAGQQELLRILEINRNDARAMTDLSRLAAAQGRNEDRLNWLRRAATAQPLALGPRVALLQAYADLGQPNRLVTETRAVERDFPNNAAAMQAAGLAYLAAKRPSDAENVFERLVARQPGAAMPRLLLARAQTAQGRTAAARQTLGTALALKGQNLAPVYGDLVALEIRAKRTPEALALAERLRGAYPRSNVGDIALGDVRLAAGQVPQAIAAYQAAKAKRFDRQAASRLAGAQLRARQPAQAIATMTAYRKANPRDARATVQLADLYMRTRQYRPALALYDGLRQQGYGNDPLVLNNLAWAAHQLRDKRAVSFAEAALKRAPRSPAIQDTLGQILVETRSDPKRGLALLQAAAKASPRDANIRYRLARAYQANGREGDAVRELQTALRTPGLTTAPQARALLAELKS